MRREFFGLLAFVLCVHFKNTFTLEEKEKQKCCDSWTKEGWNELGDVSLQFTGVCKIYERFYFMVPAKDRVFKILFRPKEEGDHFQIFVTPLLNSTTFFLAKIIGLESGRIDYRWENVTGHEWKIATGQDDALLPSRPLAGDVSWDPDGDIIYELFVGRTSDNHLEIRLDGGDPEQQKEMSFPIPEEKAALMVINPANSTSTVNIENILDCFPTKWITFEPGQDMFVNLLNPSNSVGLSLCTDTGQSDCYVLQIVGIDDWVPIYVWRKHSLYGNGTAGWVPGIGITVPGTILKTNVQNKGLFSEKFVGKFGILMERNLNGTLIVNMNLNSTHPVTFEVPTHFMYGAVAVFATEPLTPGTLKGFNWSASGPCFNGFTYGYNSPTCKHQISAEEEPPYRTENGTLIKEGAFRIWSPKPGQTVAAMRSPVLNAGSFRDQLCVSVEATVSEGADISIYAEAADGVPYSVYLGTVTYNDIKPLEWQKVRLVKELPSCLRNVSLVLKVISRRTAGSVALLRKAGLCSFDGCGLPTADGTPLIYKGERAPSAKYPWHVGIFRSLGKTSNEYICGGSLIRPDIVISAAHCFFENSVVQDKDKFKLAVGKVYNSLDINEEYQQISSALDIRIPKSYRGEAANYIADIALVRVKFTISSIVLPVCIDWSGKALRNLQDGDIGEVSGWGKTERATSSKELLFASLPYINYDKCIDAVPKDFLRLFTADKFCAGNIGGQTVQTGDSGSGLVFETTGYRYLRGIVSTGIPDLLTYTTFTDLAQYMPWIKNILTQDL